MRKFVYGKDVVVMAKKNGAPDYFPFACAETVKISMQSELLPSSTADTGAWDTYVPSGKNGFGIEMGGVLVLEDDVDTLWFGWELFLLQVRSEGLDFKIVFTDHEGNEKFATGHVFIESSEIDGPADDFATWLASMKGSGELDLSGVLDVNPEDMGDIVIRWLTSGAEPNIVQSNKLIGLVQDNTDENSRRDIKEVSWEGDDKFYVITEGEPSDREVLFDSVAGSLRFKNNFANGDYVWALVKKI